MGSVCVYKDLGGEAILIHLFRRLYWRIHKRGEAKNVSEEFTHLFWRAYWLRRVVGKRDIRYVEETVFGVTLTKDAKST